MIFFYFFSGIFLVFLLNASHSFAGQKNGNLKIIIVNQNTIPISNAKIFFNQNLVGKSNKNGVYVLNIGWNFIQNNYVRVKHNKYLPFFTKIPAAEFKSNKESLLNVLLTPMPNTLKSPELKISGDDSQIENPKKMTPIKPIPSLKLDKTSNVELLNIIEYDFRDKPYLIKLPLVSRKFNKPYNPIPIKIYYGKRKLDNVSISYQLKNIKLTSKKFFCTHLKKLPCSLMRFRNTKEIVIEAKKTGYLFKKRRVTLNSNTKLIKIWAIKSKIKNLELDFYSKSFNQPSKEVRDVKLIVEPKNKKIPPKTKKKENYSKVHLISKKYLTKSPSPLIIPKNSFNQFSMSLKEFVKPKIAVIHYPNSYDFGQKNISNWESILKETQFIDHIPQQLILNFFSKNYYSLDYIIKKSWNQSELSEKIDFLIVTRPIGKNKFYLAIKNSKGKTLFATIKNRLDIKNKSANTLKELLNYIPYELVVLKKNRNLIDLNIPKSLFLYSTEMNYQLYSNYSAYNSSFSKLEIKKSYQNYSRFKIKNIYSFYKGQQIILAKNSTIGNKKNGYKSIRIKLSKGTSKTMLEFGDIFIVDKWIGQTNASGLLKNKLIPQKGTFLVVHPDISETYLPIKRKNSSEYVVSSLKDQISLTTHPVSSKVFIENILIGHTPLLIARIKSSKLSHLSIVPDSIYESIKAKVKFDDKIKYDRNSIQLKINHIKVVNKKIDSNKFKDALNYINKLDLKTKSLPRISFLNGFILANQKKYYQCYQTYRKLNASISNFPDSIKNKYISSLINENICLSLLHQEDNIPIDLKNFENALSSLKEAEKRLNYTGKILFDSVKHSVFFYKSKIRYHLWQKTNNEKYLAKAIKGYQHYLAVTSKNTPPNKNSEIFKIEAKKIIALQNRSN